MCSIICRKLHVKRDDLMENNIGFLIKKISNRLLTEMNYNLKKYGITARQLEVLSFLNMNGDSSQKDIADYFGIRHTTVIDLLKKLEGKNLIAKIKDEKNLKFNVISLTDLGKKQIGELDGFKDEVQDIFTKELGAENQEILIQSLNKIYEKICEYDKLGEK